jgi:propionate CoA-transferase
MVSDTYFSMIGYLEKRYYSSASRYPTSAFMRMKLGEAPTERHVAPRIFETEAEAQQFARSH